LVVGTGPSEQLDEDPIGWLLARSHDLAPAALGMAVDETLEHLGARSSCVYLVDHELTHLRPLVRGAGDEGAHPLDGTIAGRCFALETLVTVPTDAGTRLWLPLIDGTARLGALQVDIDGTVEPEMLEAVQQVASLAAELVVSKSQYTDFFEHIRRRRPMALQAEMQRASLPPSAIITREVAVAGILLPAYEVAGDWYDYALNDTDLHMAIIDSVGHELESSMVSHLVSSCLRNARRNGLSLAESYVAADAVVRHMFVDLQFATAAFGRLDLFTGRFEWISAGHPRPLLVRRGKVVGEAPGTPVLPIGLSGQDPHVNEVALEAGDALLFYTDGVTEGGIRGTERFGLPRLIDLLGRGMMDDLPVAELMRRLSLAVMEHAAFELHDDMTMVLIEYRNPLDTPTSEPAPATSL
jgi:serine phosphatase RsbU (regulator of sigma subunit)